MEHDERGFYLCNQSIWGKQAEETSQSSMYFKLSATMNFFIALIHPENHLWFRFLSKLVLLGMTSFQMFGSQYLRAL